MLKACAFENDNYVLCETIMALVRIAKCESIHKFWKYANYCKHFLTTDEIQLSVITYLLENFQVLSKEKLQLIEDVICLKEIPYENLVICFNKISKEACEFLLDKFESKIYENSVTKIKLLLVTVINSK